MAGHNKWSQIKRKKWANDARRGKLFTKLIREITVAAREGGGDPEYNARLRAAIDQAKTENMPQDNIDRAVKRGTGELEGARYESMTYEGYGPGGVALFIEATTDNGNRTVQEVRHLLDKFGGKLGTDGSVAWQFERKGQIVVDAGTHEEEEVLAGALEAGAEDVTTEGEEFIVTTVPTELHQVNEAMRAAGIETRRAELTMIPTNEVRVEGSEAGRLLKLLDALDDSDDVQNVHSNADIDEALMAEAAS